MTRSFLRFAAISLAFVCGFTSLHAQSALASLRPAQQSNRIAANADLGPQTQLTGHLPRWVSGGTQAASRPVDLSANMNITIVLQRDPAVQAAFEKFLADQQTPGNPLYHQWLTPQQVGTLFGPTASDVAAVTNWLTAQGITVDQVSNSRIMIDAHGSAAVVAGAFRTSFAYFSLSGTPRLSATSEPFVPTALSPVVNSISGLTDIPLHPLSHISGPHQMALPQGSASNPQPQLTTGSGSTASHFLTPNDFAVIYDINSVYNGGNKGATIGSKPQHVAIIGRSNVATSDITEYITNVASSFNINNLTPVYPTGVSPGPPCTYVQAETNSCSTADDQGEQTLDVDRVIGTAPGAYVDLVVSTSINTDIAYNVNTLLDPVMTISYGLCELQSNVPSYNVINNYFSTGAAEGITILVSSGDSGANGCAADGTATTVTNTASSNYLCASSYATCVGGVEFNDTASPSTYWSATNGTGYESVLSYIPEGGWNEPSGSCATTGTYCPLASGGGPSTFNTTKPSWQTGTGVPADGVRDTPDVAYPAAGHDGFYACEDFAYGAYNGQGNPPITSASNCTTAGGGYFWDFSGTSAAAPSIAGVAALLNTKLGAAQGNLNPLLYKLAATTSNNVFHDTTVATSGVSGCSITVPSMCNNSTPGSSADLTTVAGGLQGYLVGTGYDEVTGWGSIDVANFLTSAMSATFTVTPTSLAYNLISGATTGNTDVITFASVNSFAGTVNYTCTVANGSGTAAGSCALSPTSGTLAANGSTTSALTITTIPGTSGVLNVTVTGTSGSTVITSSIIAVTLTASSFTLTPLPTTITLAAGAVTGNTSVVTVASVNGFAGTVTIGCTTAVVSGSPAGSCAASPSSVTLTANGTNTTTVTLTSTAGAGGVLAENISGSGTTTGGTVAATASAVVTATLTIPTFTVVPATSTYNLISGATTGNTDVFTLTSTNGFVGSVVTSCTVTNVSGTAAGTCAATTPVTLTSGGTGTSTLTITTTPGTSGVLNIVVKGTSGSTVVTASTVTVNLTASSYTMAASLSSISIAGNAVSGNTSTITLTSVNGFAGLVTVGCSSSNTAVATCTGGTATLTSGGTATITLTALPVLHTSGTGITLTASGSGTTTGATIAATATTSVALTVTTTASAITVSATPSTVVAGSPTTLKATVTGTNGNPTGTVTFLANGTAITGGTGTLSTTAGVTTATYTYTPAATSASATAVQITATYAGDTGYAGSAAAATPLAVSGTTASAAQSSLSFTSGATTGNTDVITFTSVSGYAGTVTAGCSIVATTGSPAFPATCAASAPAAITAGGTTTTSTITITSTTAQAHSAPAQADLGAWGIRGGAMLAMLLCLVPFRRRRFIRPLAALIVMAGALAALSGCGGSPAAPVKQSSAGTYTVTTTGTSGTATVTTTFTVTIN